MTDHVETLMTQQTSYSLTCKLYLKHNKNLLKISKTYTQNININTKTHCNPDTCYHNTLLNNIYTQRYTDLMQHTHTVIHQYIIEITH